MNICLLGLYVYLENIFINNVKRLNKVGLKIGQKKNITCSKSNGKRCDENINSTKKSLRKS